MGVNMKTSIIIGAVGMLGVAMVTSASGSELAAGYLNSNSREASIVLQDNAQRIQITNTANKFYWGKVEQGSGKLFIVDSRGNIQTARTAFRDRLGHGVAIPVSNDDKVVVLNRYGNISWAIGLEDAEIMALAPRDATRLAQVVIEAQKRPVFGALRYSSPVLTDMHGDTDAIAATFLNSVHLMAGGDVELMVRRLMEKNSAGFLNGVSLVAQGGTGGGGGTGSPVAQGGTGGGGGTGLVAQGGTGGGGGTGIVAQGGTGGGGGTGLVEQGGTGGGGGTGHSADVAIKLGSVTSMNAIPAIKGLSAVAKGKIVIIQ